MPTPLHDNHPRPLMARKGWTDLCGPWQFAYDDDDIGLGAGWVQRPEAFDRTILVPYPPESPASGIADTGFHLIVWYRRTVDLAAPAPGRRLLLHLGAVDYRADVWVNGRHVAAHEGGHTPIRADITHAIASGGEQVIVVRAVDDPQDLSQPRGKQDWQAQPHVIWYHRTTGIWQPVWIEEVPEAYLESLLWTPVPGGFRLDARLSRPARVEIRAGPELVHDSSAGVELSCDLTLPVTPWTPETPSLYAIELTIRSAASTPDVVHSYVGHRRVGVDSQRFLLNEQPYPLRLVLEQGYRPDTHLAAPDGAALRRDVELVKSLGFNGVRVHQKVADPRYLYWCDRLGLLVFADTAAAWAYNGIALSRTIREWTEVVARDASHPCVAAWVAFNESWGVPDVAVSPAQQHAVRAAYHLLKALDPSRPVMGNDGWEHVMGDLMGIHDYSHDPAILSARYGSTDSLRTTIATDRPGNHVLSVDGTVPDIPAVLSEFGGITYAPEAGDTWPGYGAVADEADLLHRLRELFEAVHAAPELAGFCYTQFSDTAQERNGLVTEDRVPKADPAAIVAIVQGRM